MHKARFRCNENLLDTQNNKFWEDLVVNSKGLNLYMASKNYKKVKRYTRLHY
jgi:hypothetical protein